MAKTECCKSNLLTWKKAWIFLSTQIRYLTFFPSSSVSGCVLCKSAQRVNMRDQDPVFARWDRKLNSWILSVKKLPVLIWLTTNHWADMRFCARIPPPPISPILSLCKYGPASEEVGQGSDDWRLGTIFPRYFLPLRKKDISLMEFFNNGSRGWEKDTCPIVDKIVLPATKFGNFCTTQLHTLQCYAHFAQ